MHRRHPASPRGTLSPVRLPSPVAMADRGRHPEIGVASPWLRSITPSHAQHPSPVAGALWAADRVPACGWRGGEGEPRHLLSAIDRQSTVTNGPAHVTHLPVVRE